MSEPQEKPMLTDVFVSGVKRGWGIATGSMLPNVLMAFILIYVLKLTGILDLIGTVCGPVMKVFGLPGVGADGAARRLAVHGWRRGRRLQPICRRQPQPA